MAAIQVSHVLAEDKSQPICNLLPCKLEYSGPAAVDDYFQIIQRPNEIPQCKTSFRGRPLCGKTVDVPHGYTGIVLETTLKPSEEDAENRLYDARKKFSEFTYWNLDKDPTENDVLLKLNDVLAVNKALHTNEENAD